jgi:hypothetical protein
MTVTDVFLSALPILLEGGSNLGSDGPLSLRFLAKLKASLRFGYEPNLPT